MFKRRNRSFLLILVVVIMLTGCSSTPDFKLDIEKEQGYTGDSRLVIEPDRESYTIRDEITLTAYPEDKFQQWETIKLGADDTEKEVFNQNVQELRISNFKEITAVFSDTQIKININKEGSIGFLGQTMQMLLAVLYNFTKSYGLAIILLTILVRVVLYPLTHKQNVSMKKMQELQPEMKRLQEKYANNKEKLQEETMKLYQKHKINPLAGCFPLLIQMPFLIGLFQGVQGWEALIGQPFLIIPDLSAPYIPLVILTGLVTIVQSLLTQNQSSVSFKDNPKKFLEDNLSGNKMVLMMPIFIMFLGLSLPAGVLLYWFMSNLIMVIQQYVISKNTNVELKEESN